MMIGEAGELIVASRFLIHGMLCDQLPRGFHADDLYVKLDTGEVRVQVKTTIGSKSWPIGTKVDEPSQRFWAFVYFSTEDLVRPSVYLLPHAKVVEVSLLHSDLYRASHAQTGVGVPNVADKWRLWKKMSEFGYGPGWMDQYLEPWERFRDSTLF